MFFLRLDEIVSLRPDTVDCQGTHRAASLPDVETQNILGAQDMAENAKRRKMHLFDSIVPGCRPFIIPFHQSERKMPQNFLTFDDAISKNFMYNKYNG